MFNTQLCILGVLLKSSSKALSKEKFRGSRRPAILGNFAVGQFRVLLAGGENAFYILSCSLHLISWQLNTANINKASIQGPMGFRCQILPYFNYVLIPHSSFFNVCHLLPAKGCLLNSVYQTLKPSKKRAFSVIRTPLLCKMELGKCIKGQIICIYPITPVSRKEGKKHSSLHFVSSNKKIFLKNQCYLLGK